MNNKVKLIYVLKQIELKKLLNDSSLGSYAKIHAEHLFLNYYDYYCDYLKQRKLMKYLAFIEMDAREMYDNILKEFGDHGPASWKNAEDWVISKLRAKLNRKTSSPYPFL